MNYLVLQHLYTNYANIFVELTYKTHIFEHTNNSA